MKTHRGVRTTKRHRARHLCTVLAIPVLLVLSAGGVKSQEVGNEPPAQEDPWTVLRPLVGWWEGSVDGILGTGRAVRRYAFVIGGNYLLSRHSSVRLPQEKSPEGDHHQEMGVFSYDRERKRLVYREFMIEGVVPRSVCETGVDTIVCTTEAVESGPGIRAKLTLEFVDRHRFVERYELAFPGQELRPYIEIQWTRKPTPEVWN